MKIIIGLTLLFFSILVAAQDVTTIDTIIRFGITERGKPEGTKTEMKIGKEGGSFTSSDGKVRLVFPEGALSRKTTISIQPAANLGPNGNGKAYYMEPSGTSFQQPVQIIFYYTGDETEGSWPELMGIATQDEKGLWSPLNNTELDTSLKTIKASITHFSSYINYSRAKIEPASAKVKVSGSLRLKIIYTADPDDDLLAPLGTNEINYSEAWSVNGIPKGNSTVGLISVSQNKSAIFQAPAQVPEQNPVAVSVQGSYNSKRYKVTRLVSNITIYDDAYEVKMFAFLTGGSREAWGGIVTYIDEGSFIVSLEKNKPAIIDVRNKLEIVTDNCLKRILNPTTCTGLLHIAGTRQIKVTPADPPAQPYPIVEIWFVQYPTELTRFNFLCPPPPSARGSSKGTVDLTTSAPGLPPPMLMFFGMPALPTYIKFTANDEEQVILEKRSPGGEIYYKFWVRKIKVN